MFNGQLEINGQFLTSARHFRIFFPMEKGLRLRPNLTLANYFSHLMKLDHAHGFVTHHSFTAVCTNMLWSYTALNTVNVFARRCAPNLSVAELKRVLLEEEKKVLNKLLYFAAPIPATRQNLR